MTLEQIQTDWITDPIHTEQRAQYTAIADATILAVAVVHVGMNEWVVYMHGVAGINHDHEWLDVRRHGSKVSEAMAKLLFPQMPEGMKYSSDL
jgi:hypothetical protein